MARGKDGAHPRKKADRTLPVIPKADEGTRSVLHLGKDVDPGPVIRFDGGPKGFDYSCGACGFVLINGAPPGGMQGIRDVVLLCPSCGAYNDTGGSPKLN